uniref:X-box-binding protein 1 n=1 Tax=Pinctada fucata TaxID=50426 RepID=A0A194AQD9_PINFU
MSLMPKTIIITTGKTQKTVTVQNQPTMNFDDLYSMEEGGGPRKRRRLTHLTPEEKLMRRKLKNRVAAQTARDRKKALMSDLEVQLAQLQEENKRLQRENNALKSQSGDLAVENAQLKERLGIEELPIKEEVESHGSAASVVSLPQGQTQTPSRLVNSLITLSLWMSILNTSAPTKEALQKLRLANPQKLSSLSMEQMAPLLKWWGRHQQNWNPSMN